MGGDLLTITKLEPTKELGQNVTFCADMPTQATTKHFMTFKLISFGFLK